MRIDALFIAHDAQDLEQADEDIEDAQIQAVGGHDVVGLATIDDAAGIEQDKAAHEQDDGAGNGQGQGGHGQEDVGDSHDEDDHDTGEQEPAHETEVPLAGQGIAGKT